MGDARQVTVANSYSSTREKSLPLSDPADEEENVFIPLEATVRFLKKIVARGGGGTTFVRAPVAAGKTTLAKYLATKHSDEFVMVDVTGDEQDIITAITNDGPNHSLPEALEALAASKKTLILDEAQIVFSFPTLSFELFKAPEHWIGIPKLKILLFSAAGEGLGTNGPAMATRAEIRKKYMWYPPMPDGATMSASLTAAGVFLNPESVDFFMKICSGHRGIFMSAMEWVQEMQQEQDGVGTTWDIHQSVARVRSSLNRRERKWEEGIRRYMKKSRAVRVNGNFSDIEIIPPEFAKVLFGGPKSNRELGGQNVRQLTVSGFLVPERRSSTDEFVKYDWTEAKTYCVANSLMAEYYYDRFKSELSYKDEWIRKNPHSAADLIARALPFMTFATVIDIPAIGNPLQSGDPLPSGEGEASDAPMSQSETMLQSPLSRERLPFEDHYNGALAAVLKKLGFTVSQLLDPVTGKVDLVVTYGGRKTCALETIMATRSQNDHTEYASRFGNPEKSSCGNATLKGLVIIGTSKETVLDRLRRTSGPAGLEVIGLVVSAAHDAYEMYVRPCSLQEETRGPFFLVCDQVARGLETREDGDHIVAVNRLLIPKKRKRHDDTNYSQGKLRSET